ncbi:hypothetical protein IEQ34_007493 [Dendrobium chrysotoxum]|uniref:Uncharacterized protein n=1 Tax=Dendrobium chrysotoxum TaxID=161865 RepID=A0AAV7H1L4_DENCH|nr:hypothetical protein IEQ34_007493 [Dendrobium chrysotoxum]
MFAAFTLYVMPKEFLELVERMRLVENDLAIPLFRQDMNKKRLGDDMTRRESSEKRSRYSNNKRGFESNVGSVPECARCDFCSPEFPADFNNFLKRQQICNSLN